MRAYINYDPRQEMHWADLRPQRWCDIPNSDSSPQNRADMSDHRMISFGVQGHENDYVYHAPSSSVLSQIDLGLRYRRGFLFS